ncbi:metal ABC transporter solute-binding protein, Zn/Mn family [Vallitalea guaymasensis]|uniref:metal ABC transporter solute-binding protein, Zn/Mn family n=1 Tax=Vallitalea guaymasensis TaxID=1185412 RepID=UPI00272B0AE7|nr:zinc ABC transporter substrate-binding protein [Vallitalea guaymasensis]
MKTKKIISMIAVTMLLILLNPGCSNNKNSDVEKPVIAVTIVPEKTFVEKVCGDMFDVITLVPAGNSPANYEPTPKEMEQFSNAKLYFSIGVPTEQANILSKATDMKDMKIIKLQDEVAQAYSPREFAPGKIDPHIWLSPKRVKTMVESIVREVSSFDPDNKDVYKENGEKYIAELDKLDKDIQESLKDIENRKFIVFHPAFGYLADDYNLQMYALEKNGKDATPQSLKEMIDLAKAENIKAIFYQSEISSKQAQSFADEISGKTVQLSPLAPNYIENIENIIQYLTEVME